MLSEYKTQLVHPDGDGGVVIETKQDCSDIVEQNKKEFNSFDERARWGNDIFSNKVASIPLTAIDDLQRKGIMRGFAVVDQKKFNEWLNHPDQRFFRTRPGKL
jgi:hypothetical protein